MHARVPCQHGQDILERTGAGIGGAPPLSPLLEAQGDLVGNVQQDLHLVGLKVVRWMQRFILVWRSNNEKPGPHTNYVRTKAL